MALIVSIIVPVYNVEKYIADCFQSIVNQTYTGPIECLFIDDCGTDNSIRILEGMIDAYKGPIDMRLLHHDNNRGLSAARNTGISHCKGDYIFFLDSDDQLYPHSINALSVVADKEGLPDIILGSYSVNDSEHPINSYKYEYKVWDSHSSIVHEFLCDRLYCMAHNKLVRRNFIIDNELFFKEGIIHEDTLWSFQSFHLAERVVTISDITYLYLVHSGSIMTSTESYKRLDSTRKIYDVIVNDISEKRYEPLGEKSLNYVKDILNTRCVRVFDRPYYLRMKRKDRLQYLRSIPEDVKSILKDYWFTQILPLKIQKYLLLNGFYRTFDLVVYYCVMKQPIPHCYIGDTAKKEV